MADAGDQTKSPSDPDTISLMVEWPDESDLPIQYVNTVSIRTNIHAFEAIIDFGVVIPPTDQASGAIKDDVIESGVISVRPVARLGLTAMSLLEMLQSLERHRSQLVAELDRLRGRNVESQQAVAENPESSS